MANWCRNKLAVYGPVEETKKFRKIAPNRIRKIARDIMQQKDKSFVFDTRYAPPLGWFQEIAQEYPQLSFHFYYFEEMMGSEGSAYAVGKDFIHRTWDIAPFDNLEQEDTKQQENEPGCGWHMCGVPF